ncbi:MAG: protein kinase [Chloroflexi bacterium]|nr:protein kinase [Chloroflexota bacterium]
MLPKQIGRYRVESEIGSGGQAIVYKCRDSKTGEIVAVKALRAQGRTDAARLERFHREVEIASGIRHQNVVRILELGTDDDLHYAVMEYVPGSLSELIEDSGALEPKRALEIATDSARGLAAAHARGIVHRDVKPQNILVDTQGRAKLTDFGVARALDSATMTRTGAIVGTPYYMSPEQVDGKRADIRSDIYSLGCVLFEMLAGQVPFDGETPFAVMRSHMETEPPDVHTLNAEVDQNVTALLKRCLAKEPASRFQTPDDLVAALETLTGAQRSAEIMRPGASSAVTLEGDDFAPESSKSGNPRLGGMIPALTVASLSVVLTVLVISAFGIVDLRFWEDDHPIGSSSVAGPATPQNPPVFIYSPTVVDTPEVVRVSLATSAPTGSAEMVITSLGDRSPVSTSPPVVSTLEFIEIALSGIETSQFDGAEIEFGIDTLRRAAAGQRDSVVAYRFVEDWVPLPTTFVRAEGTAEIFRAVTPGFSFFAITVSDAIPPDDVIADASPTPESISPTANATAGTSPQPTTTAVPDDAKATPVPVANSTSIPSPTATITSGETLRPEPSPATVAQVPGQPLITGVTAGDRFAVVMWTAPDSDGGAVVTGYRITAEPGNVTRVADADQRSMTLAGLESDVSYTFSVSAINSAGTGEAATYSANIPDAPNTISSLQSMEEVREGASATLLADGRLLVLGGTSSDGQFLNSGEVFNPDTGQWSVIAPMSVARANHTATLVHDGRVLVTGGEGIDGLLAGAMVYDAIRNQWESDDLMSGARSHHTATLLANGRVLIVGGFSAPGMGQAFAEIWEPEGEFFTPVQTMASARARHTATLLTNGTVLVIGGTFTNDVAVSTAEVFDLSQNIWSPVEAPDLARYDHAATRMLDGRVIVVGGVDSSGLPLNGVGIFDPKLNEFLSAPSLSRPAGQPQIGLAPDGSVVVFNENDIERYDGDWIVVGKTRSQSSAANLVILDDNRMVLTGGGTSAVEAHTPDFRPTAPGTPEQITIELAYGLLFVRWQPPLSNGGFPISGYTLNYAPGVEPVYLEGHDRKWAFFDLIEGVEYTVTVQAETVAGASVASVPISTVFSTPPGAPMNVTAVAGQGSATITWDSPANAPFLPILNYVIFDEINGVFADVPGDVTKWVVKDLKPGKTFQFVVKATSDAGFGEHSAPSAEVVPR